MKGVRTRYPGTPNLSRLGGRWRVRSLRFEGVASGAGPCKVSYLVMDEIPSMGIFVELPGNGGFDT